ncbi:hypothetical protein TVAG_424960 [Trichomonas vaginalis G3]|uniref:Uncharacterized protein n=2 Tax=Trichomonas vaginalis (strain ATCC PRA-98 / G3) TaxID=412133 RepID=A2F5E6_TRIV3|nr:trehalase family [Trichomonas vaginalis G3]EAX99859.1 hypothetical protein TVAG_424960 [Trichomonas vaginalis G3]KAI5549610.1 trehalase family [Trichomonas vaginalis G3]|eukprot:XP_001312789.1 hypothetical protein [Trichomonas vaginalis G3]
MLFFFANPTLSATERAIPSYWLNNWDKTNPVIGYWSTAQKSWTVEPSMHPGINHLKAYDDLTRDVITSDSFAVSIDGQIYGNDMLFNNSHLSGCVQEVDGELFTTYDAYRTDKMPISIRRSFYMPPHEEFYLVKYTIKSTDGNSHNIKLLDYVISGNDEKWTKGRCSGNSCLMDRKESNLASVAISIDTNYKPLKSVGNSDFNDDSNPLKYFAANGVIQKFTSYNQASVSFGAVYEFTISPSKETVVTSIRSFGRTTVDAVNHLTMATVLGVDAIIKMTNERYTQFLSQGVQTSLTDDALDLYKKSILTLKNSQNPAKGLIASSLHPSYGYKNWMRDSLMAAFMLDSAGYHQEAKDFFNWVDNAELTNGGFHTTYDTMTGNVAPFVEPQYDSVGLYLVALNYHLKTIGDKDWVKSKMTRIREMENFIFQKNSNYHNFPPSDRSPWEESTDHHTKEPVPQQWYSFEMGCLYGGIRAAYSIEKEFGDTTRASQCQERADELKKGVMETLWDSETKRLYRGIRDNDLKDPDTKADSASMTCVFFGLLDSENALSHLNFIKSKLTKLESGIARYENDPYFYDSVWNPCGEGTMETQQAEPAWPVVTAYVAWSEHLLGIDFQKRLDWMVKYAAFGNMPVGEGVDSKDGAMIVPSAPDCFEHAGVYVYSVLLKEGKVKSLVSTF